MITQRSTTFAMLATPALSFATLAIALGLGAHGETLAAIVYAAPPGASRDRLAWQIQVMYEDRGVREVKPNLPIVVEANWNGHSTSWRSVTTGDGVAEMILDYPGIAPGDDVDLSIWADEFDPSPVAQVHGHTTLLAQGRAHVPEGLGRGNTSRSNLLPLRREGEIIVDAAILGSALASEFPTELWVHAKDHDNKSIAGVQVHLDDVDGLTVATNDVTTCDDGWAKLDVTARALAVTATIRLKSGAFIGLWNGPLPIVLGATRALVIPDKNDTGNLHASIVRPLVTKSAAYVEIDDDVGRVFAATVPLTASENDFARAEIGLPKLASGKYWIVAGSEPRAAETMTAGSFAIPFRITEKIPGACDVGGELATFHAGGFSRLLVVDGFVDARRRATKRRRRGMSIAFGSLALGAIVEAILLLRAARSGTNVRSPEANRSWIARTPGAVVIGIGMSLLGFALLAAFIATH